MKNGFRVCFTIGDHVRGTEHAMDSMAVIVMGGNNRTVIEGLRLRDNVQPGITLNHPDASGQLLFGHKPEPVWHEAIAAGVSAP